MILLVDVYYGMVWYGMDMEINVDVEMKKSINDYILIHNV